MRFSHDCGATLCLLLHSTTPYFHYNSGGIIPHPKGLTNMFITNVIGVFRQWRRYNASLRELNRLDDRELADLGISRGDIPRLAWESSER